jgi:preprotein translocase subunit SecG
MSTIILVIHLMLALTMIFLVLIQKSEGGGLGIGGGGSGGGMGGFMTGRATSNLLTRATAILAALFMLTSLGLALLADSDRRATSVMDRDRPAAAQPAEEQAPATPQVPTDSNR